MLQNALGRDLKNLRAKAEVTGFKHLKCCSLASCKHLSYTKQKKKEAANILQLSCVNKESTSEKFSRTQLKTNMIAHQRIGSTRSPEKFPLGNEQVFIKKNPQIITCT